MRLVYDATIYRAPIPAATLHHNTNNNNKKHSINSENLYNTTACMMEGMYLEIAGIKAKLKIVSSQAFSPQTNNNNFEEKKTII